MDFWSPDNFREITAGRWLHRPTDGSPLAELTGVSTDSRTLKPGHVFVALRGEKFDGHDYLGDAVDAGAPLLIVETEDLPETAFTPRNAVLLVDDTLKTLARLATAYRRTLSAKVIAITGSVGKTTTKLILHSVLRQRYRGSASPKSFNNNIGVPLTLLAVKPGDQYVICEVGTNAPGEIAALARIADPDIAVITHAGRAHLEKLGDVDAVVKEKSSLLSFLRPHGLAVVNGDIPKLLAASKVAPTLISYGRSPEADLRLTDCAVTPDGEGVSFEVNGRSRFHLPLLGEHNAFNSVGVVAVARHMKLTDEDIQAGFSDVPSPAQRLTPLRITTPSDPIRVIDDSYNANPESMQAALDVLRQSPTAGRRVAVLGDMLELGAAGPTLHREMGEQIAATEGIDEVVFVGRLSLYAAETLTRAWPEQRVHAIPTWTEHTADEIAAVVQPGDTVLIKGSRAIGLERIVPALRQRFDRQPQASDSAAAQE